MIRLLAVSFAALVGFAVPASAQAPASQGFPSRTIRFIVPFTPGGSNDVVAREIAAGLQARFNQPVVVENKPGGGGTIGYVHVAKSPPDGYKIGRAHV